MKILNNTTTLIRWQSIIHEKVLSMTRKKCTRVGNDTYMNTGLRYIIRSKVERKRDEYRTIVCEVFPLDQGI